MLCAECPRCHRRSIIGKPPVAITDQPAPEPPEGAQLRCDICGSKNVRIHRFPSPIEALRFVNQRS